MILLKLILIISFVCLFSKSSFALTNQQIQSGIEQNDRIQQQLEQQRQDIIRKKELEEIKRIRKSRKFEEDKNGVEELEDNGGCVNLEAIQIKGNTVFKAKKLRKKFLNKYVNQNTPVNHYFSKNFKAFEKPQRSVQKGTRAAEVFKQRRNSKKNSDLQGYFQCLRKKDIATIQKELTDYYISKGYSNARVYFDVNKLIKEKILLILIAEGLVENVELNNNSKLDSWLDFRQKSKLFTAFGFKKNKVFNLRDFEQGLDQINSLASSNATMKSRPANQEGYSDIIINNQITNPTNFTAAYDNLGQSTTGRYRRKFSISQDNLLALNDNIYLNYTKDDVSNKSEKFNDSFYGSISIPFNYWTSLFSFSKSKYLTTINAQNTSFSSSGQTLLKTFELNRVLKRGQRFKSKLGANLNLKDTASYIDNSRNETASRNLTYLETYLENIFYIKAGTFLLKPSYVKGLDWFDARSDDKNITSVNPHAQYDILKLYAYYNTNFTIPKTNLPFTYTISANLQHSLDALFASEQLSLGGYYSIRGFNDNSISGDRGYNVRNDLKINAFRLLPSVLRNSKLFNIGNDKNLSLNNIFSKSYLSVFYDYGYVRNKVIDDETDEGYMSGIGSKLSYFGKYFTANLTYSKGLHSPAFIENVFDQNKDEETIYFDVSLAFGI